MIDDCEKCKYALWDCAEFYGTTDKQWFISGCKKDQDMETEDCEEYKEWDIVYDD